MKICDIIDKDRRWELLSPRGWSPEEKKIRNVAFPFPSNRGSIGSPKWIATWEELYILASEVLGE